MRFSRKWRPSRYKEDDRIPLIGSGAASFAGRSICGAFAVSHKGSTSLGMKPGFEDRWHFYLALPTIDVLWALPVRSWPMLQWTTWSVLVLGLRKLSSITSIAFQETLLWTLRLQRLVRLSLNIFWIRNHLIHHSKNNWLFGGGRNAERLSKFFESISGSSDCSLPPSSLFCSLSSKMIEFICVP